MIDLNAKAVIYGNAAPVFYLTLTITGQGCGSEVTLGRIFPIGVI